MGTDVNFTMGRVGSLVMQIFIMGINGSAIMQKCRHRMDYIMGLFSHALRVIVID